MTRRRVISGSIAGAMLVVLCACAETHPTRPVGTDAEGHQIDRVPTIETIRHLLAEAFPEPPDGAQVYVGESPDEWGGIARFVVKEEGSFELQYLRSDSHASIWRGAHVRSGPIITFDFDLWSAAGPTLATASLHEGGTKMKVEYNIVMWLTDFRGGWYVIDPAG